MAKALKNLFPYGAIQQLPDSAQTRGLIIESLNTKLSSYEVNQSQAKYSILLDTS